MPRPTLPTLENGKIDYNNSVVSDFIYKHQNLLIDQLEVNLKSFLLNDSLSKYETLSKSDKNSDFRQIERIERNYWNLLIGEQAMYDEILDDIQRSGNLNTNFAYYNHIYRFDDAEQATQVIEQILSKYRGLRSKLNGSNVRKEAVA
ncbi:MAG: hypothetical protein LBV67_01595 [Streptococcaceae bacterium]|jgi:hypothetical protein|nr:hypothetical protein [Streptococcaceae bacterium]